MRLADIFSLGEESQRDALVRIPPTAFEMEMQVQL